MLRRRTPHAVATAAIVAMNVLVFIAMAVDAGGIDAFSSTVLIRWGAMFGPRTAHGEWWRLLTATFVHTSAVHLVFNMLALLLIGPVTERLVGSRAFLAWYVGAGLAGAAASLMVHPVSAGAGASGSILGLYGVLLVMMFERSNSTSPAGTRVPPVPRHQLLAHVQPVVYVVLSTLVYGAFDPRADNAAHVGGFVAGCLFAWAGGRDIESFLPARRVAAAALAVAVGFCAVSLAAHRDRGDVHSALLSVFVMDSRALVQYSKMASARAEPQAVSRLIETEIIPAFSKERAKLVALAPVSPVQRRLLADLQQYLVLREEYWRQRAAGVDTKDEGARGRINAADRSADAVMRRLLSAR